MQNKKFLNSILIIYKFGILKYLEERKFSGYMLGRKY